MKVALCVIGEKGETSSALQNGVKLTAAKKVSPINYDHIASKVFNVYPV